MDLNHLDQPVQSQHIYDAFAEIAKKDYDRAEAILAEGLGLAKKDDNSAMLAVFYSAFGVLYKLKRDFRQAWRYYDQAEKLLPHNPVLKLISARLLLEVFSQCDVAIRKMKKVEAMHLHDPLVEHHVNAIYGLAYAKKGNKTQSRSYLEKLLQASFADMVSASNIDFKLIEACVRKGWHRDLCNAYLEKAIAFAEATKEEPYSRLFKKLFAGLQKEEPQVL